jgi:nucleoid DNA-binding protein
VYNPAEEVLAISLQESGFMTKKEIAQTIAHATGLTALQTQVVVQKTMDAIIATLLTDRRIELRRFGVFEVKKRAGRKARNPQTGEKVFVSERLAVKFQPGSEMIERLRGLEIIPKGTSGAA